MDGSEKHKSNLVIEKTMKPQSFKGVKTFSIDYLAKTKSLDDVKFFNNCFFFYSKWIHKRMKAKNFTVFTVLHCSTYNFTFLRRIQLPNCNHSISKKLLTVLTAILLTGTTWGESSNNLRLLMKKQRSIRTFGRGVCSGSKSLNIVLWSKPI